MKKGSTSEYDINADKLQYFPPPGSSRDQARSIYGRLSRSEDLEAARDAYMSRPYITLVMELGVTEKVPSYAVTPSKVIKARDVVQSPTTPAKNTGTGSNQSRPLVSTLTIQKGPQRAIRARTKHPRYNFHAYGCSSTLYRCVTEETESMYRSLLRVGNVIVEHPRPQNIDAVRTLKPGFTASKEPFSWVDDDYLTGELEDPSDEVIENAGDSTGDSAEEMEMDAASD